jgi:hypothetical protein
MVNALTEVIMPDEATETLDEEQRHILSQFTKMICKVTEIQSMMKNGEFIVAYEKLGGVYKNLLATGGLLQRRFGYEADGRSVSK